MRKYPSSTNLQVILPWLLLIVAVLAVYGHTLDVPFYLDDFSSIKENPAIYKWQGTLLEIWRSYTLRTIGYLSFALNYHFHQFQVAGYHIVNIIIHLLNGWMVLWLLRGLVDTPRLEGVSARTRYWLPLVAALMFVLHPLQIQGVTYIVQRLASMAALFYLAAMAAFIQARLSNKLPARLSWSTACLLCAILAFFTKQNTVTLPLALFLLEVIFFPHQIRRLVSGGVIVIIGLGLVWVALALGMNSDPFSLEAMQSLTRETSKISRISYLTTQMTVLWTYIRLFFYPVGLHIDYYYPVIKGVLDGQEAYPLLIGLMHSRSFWALLGHCLLLAVAAYNLRRRPLAAFGIFFYYLAHAVESSLIPIRDVIFEHRTYLPNLGLVTLCGWLLVEQLPRWLNWRITQVIIICLLLALGAATWTRNQIWRDPVALWQQNVAESPEKIRGWIILGKHLIKKGKLQAEQGQTALSRSTLKLSLATLNHAVDKKNVSAGEMDVRVSPEAVLNLIVAHKILGQYEQALEWIKLGLTQQEQLRPFDHAKFLVNRGNIYYEQAREKAAQNFYREARSLADMAEDSYRQAIKIDENNITAWVNLANLLTITGRFPEAISIYQQMLEIDPGNQLVIKNLNRARELAEKYSRQ